MSVKHWLELDCFLKGARKNNLAIYNSETQRIEYGRLDYNTTLQSILDHKNHLEFALAHTQSSNAIYSHCQKELVAIQELLEKEGALQAYVEVWNSAIDNLFTVKNAANEYGKSVGSLFCLNYINMSE